MSRPARYFATAIAAFGVTSCFYGHPVTGVAPGDSEDASGAEALSVLALPSAAPATADSGTNPAAAPTEIYLFQASTLSPNGDLRNGQPTARQGADLRCSTSPPALPVSCGQIRAMISIDAADEIRDMPANYGLPTNQPIYPPGGAALRLAPDWTDLLNAGTPLERTLTAAGLGGTGAWWSFSLAGGSVSPANCANGTDGTFPPNSPGLGDETATGTDWIQAPFGSFCSASGQLLCLCFTP